MPHGGWHRSGPGSIPDRASRFENRPCRSGCGLAFAAHQSIWHGSGSGLEAAPAPESTFAARHRLSVTCRSPAPQNCKQRDRLLSMLRTSVEQESNLQHRNYHFRALPLSYPKGIETGIEPALLAPEASALPLSYSCNRSDGAASVHKSPIRALCGWALQRPLPLMSAPSGDRGTRRLCAFISQRNKKSHI